MFAGIAANEVFEIFLGSILNRKKTRARSVEAFSHQAGSAVAAASTASFT